MGRTDDQFPAIPGGPYLFLNGRRVVESQAEDAANAALDYGGDLRTRTTQGGRAIAGGLQFGIARHGDHIEFSPPYSGIPLLILRGGISDEPRAKWGPSGDGTETGVKNSGVPTYPELIARNLSATGFDLSARLKQKTGISTFVSDEFTAASGTLSGAPAYDDKYTVAYSLSATRGNSQVGTLRVVVRVDGSIVAQRDYTIPVRDEDGLPVMSKEWSNEQLQFIRSGMSTSSVVKLEMFSTVNITQFDLSFPTVSYHSSTGGAAQYASMTPDAEDFIEWYALGATADLTP